jgi:hypothetical protein
VGILSAILVILTGLVLARAARNPQVSPLTIVAVAGAFLLWYAIPTVAYLVLPWHRVAAGYDEAAYANLLSLENASFLAVCAILLWRRPVLRPLVKSPLASTETPDRVTLVVLIVVVVVSVAVRQAASAVMGTSYFERNAFAMRANEEALAIAGGIGFVLALANAVGYACIVKPGGGTRNGKAVLLLGVGWIGYGVLDDLTTGARIAVLTPLAVLIFRAALERRAKKSRVLGLSGAALATVVAAAILSIVIGQSRGAADIPAPDLTVTSTDLVETNTISEIGQRFLEELTVKFNAPLGGLILLQSQGEGAAGWTPFLGALLALVPRYVLPEKPVPGSADGQYSGHPSRIAAAHMEFSGDAGNVGVSAAAVAVWELGYLGIVLFVVLGWANLLVLNSFFSGRSLSFIVLGLMMCGLPAFGSVMPTPDASIQSIMRSLAIVGVLFILRTLFGGGHQRQRGAISVRSDRTFVDSGAPRAGALRGGEWHR